MKTAHTRIAVIPMRPPRPRLLSARSLLRGGSIGTSTVTHMASSQTGTSRDQLMTQCLSHRMEPILNAQLHLSLFYMTTDGFLPQFEELSDALRPVPVRCEPQHRQFPRGQSQPISDPPGIGPEDLL